MGFFPSTALPFRGRFAELQEVQRNGGLQCERLRWVADVCVVSRCFPMDRFINIPEQKSEGPLQTN